MSDFLGFLGLSCLVLAIGLVGFFSSFSDPEKAAEKLGRCVAAFRRGLKGETTQGNAEGPPSSNTEQHVGSPNRN
jgi:hypothetical protein